jgi:hypothetical protein
MWVCEKQALMFEQLLMLWKLRHKPKEPQQVNGC